MFLSHSARLKLTVLPAGELDMAEFQHLVSPETDSLAHNAA